MKAILHNYHQAPRKVRLAADLIRGKKLTEAFTLLRFLPKRAALPLAKLLSSAAASASLLGHDDHTRLVVKEIAVDKGLVMKRFRPRARGRASPINRRSSQVKIILGYDS